jgi:hypothetical protein
VKSSQAPLSGSTSTPSEPRKDLPPLRLKLPKDNNTNGSH